MLEPKQYSYKTLIGRTDKGFDFLGYQLSVKALTLANQTTQHFREHLQQLYEQQQAAPQRAVLLGDYVTRWLRWTQAELDELSRDHRFQSYHSRDLEEGRQFGNENDCSQKTCRRLRPVFKPINRSWVKRRKPTTVGNHVHYERRRSGDTILYQLVQEHVETFFAQVETEIGTGLPEFVKEEFDVFLKCGVLAHGFLRLRCSDCAHEMLVAFSCKRRGFCPSCGARRMALFTRG